MSMLPFGLHEGYMTRLREVVVEKSKIYGWQGGRVRMRDWEEPIVPLGYRFAWSWLTRDR